MYVYTNFTASKVDPYKLRAFCLISHYLVQIKRERQKGRRGEGREGGGKGGKWLLKVSRERTSNRMNAP